jgi:glyoxylase-like metal-dependent hydrolase (beta-lactamase superfamily II)
MTDNIQSPQQTLSYPFAAPPELGQVIEVAPGVLWTRIPLPFRLNHVNVYAIEDGDGWAIIDTGLDYADARATWDALLAGPLSGRRLTRVIVTHFHPDHIGLAGWLCARFNVPMLTTQTAYLGCLNVALRPGNLLAEPYRGFYLTNGFDVQAMEKISTEGHDYMWKVAPLPPTFSRVVAGDVLDISGRSFAVLTAEGHAAEQLMLYCASEKLFFPADEVLAKITPNVSVWPVDPDGDPLGLYLRSLEAIKLTIPEDVLVLPGHQLPFYGLHKRCDELGLHHEMRCSMIADACRKSPRTAADLVPVLFHHIQLDAHQMGFAFSEVMAHVNYMIRCGELERVTMQDGIHRLMTK